MKPRIYFDYAATTPVDERVISAMLPYFTNIYGNPSSIHLFGQQAEAALETARDTVARTLNCLPDEVIFTSCGTESDNLAIRGVCLTRQRNYGANHILISPVEHHAVSHTTLQLEEFYGFQVEYLPVDQYGMVHPDDVATRIRQNTALVSVIYANNEIGTVNPISEIGAVCRQKGVPFHTDAVQAAVYLSVDVESLNVDLMSIGAHKFYGPKGVGALYIRKGTEIIPCQTGGGQEYSLRAGTHNVPYIVGLAEAFQLAQKESKERGDRLQKLREKLIHEVLSKIPASKLTGHPTQRMPNHTSFIFENVDGNTLLVLLDSVGFACSSGSACKTGNPEPSSVLMALGIPHSWALGSLRVTLGVNTIPEHIDMLLPALEASISQIRKQRKL